MALGVRTMEVPVNIGLTEPAGLVAYDVKRTTTDKLEEVLNAYPESWHIDQITHVGGRDWVVVARYEFASVEERDETFPPFLNLDTGTPRL